MKVKAKFGNLFEVIDVQMSKQLIIFESLY
jgi:hypothetical protein